LRKPPLQPSVLAQFSLGSTYTDKAGNKFTSKYTGLLTAQANGTDKKTGATLYKLTLYDQNIAVATGTGFSGGMGHPAIKDGNYLLHLEIRDPKGLGLDVHENICH
jgi:hypothetical protein